eukprot:g34402.t1
MFSLSQNFSTLPLSFTACHLFVSVVLTLDFAALGSFLPGLRLCCLLHCFACGGLCYSCGWCGIGDWYVVFLPQCGLCVEVEPAASKSSQQPARATSSSTSNQQQPQFTGQHLSLHRVRRTSPRARTQQQESDCGASGAGLARVGQSWGQHRPQVAHTGQQTRSRTLLDVRYDDAEHAMHQTLSCGCECYAQNFVAYTWTGKSRVIVG